MDTKDLFIQKVFDADLSEYDTFTGAEVKNKCAGIDQCVMEHVQKLCSDSGVVQQVAENVLKLYAGKLKAFDPSSEPEKQAYPGPDEFYINEALQKELCRLAE